MLNKAGEAIQCGVTTDEIDIIAHNACIAAGAYPSPLLYRGFPKSICTSVNNVACHGIPDDRPLCDGDIVNVDVTVSFLFCRQVVFLDINITQYDTWWNHCMLDLWGAGHRLISSLSYLPHDGESCSVGTGIRQLTKRKDVPLWSQNTEKKRLGPIKIPWLA